MVFSPVLDGRKAAAVVALVGNLRGGYLLATVMGVATVRGYEGSDLSSSSQCFCFLKHYVVIAIPPPEATEAPRLFRKLLA